MTDLIQAVTMPKWGLAMSEGMITEWHVAEGDAVAAGDDLVDIETTKITNVFEAPAAGILRRRYAGDGETLPVGALLGVIANEFVPDSDIDVFVTRFRETFAARAKEEEAAAPEPETIEANGQRLRYLAMGDGDGVPLLLLHGFGADLNNWLFNQPVLAEDRRVYALDLPGHGGSTKNVGAGDAVALADAVRAFLDAVAIERAHLVGHSLGGAVALVLALEQPARVASATLIAGAALGSEINADFINGFIAADRRKQLRPVLELLVHDPAMISRDMIDDVLKYKRLDGARAALEQIAARMVADGHQTLQLADRLNAVTMPVQVIWGSEDKILPSAHAEALAASGKLATRILGDAGHMVHMEKATEVNALIRDFVAG